MYEPKLGTGLSRPQVYSCGVIAKALGASKKQVVYEAKEYLRQKGLERSSFLELEVNDRRICFGSTDLSVHLGKMFFFGKMINTEFYSEVNDLLSNYGASFVVFYSGSLLMCMREDVSYNGAGAIFVRDERTNRGHVIEPLVTYMKGLYPIYVED